MPHRSAAAPAGNSVALFGRSRPEPSEWGHRNVCRYAPRRRSCSSTRLTHDRHIGNLLDSKRPTLFQIRRGSAICGNSGDSVCVRSTTRIRPDRRSAASVVSEFAGRNFLASGVKPLEISRSSTSRDSLPSRQPLLGYVARVDVLDAVLERLTTALASDSGVNFGGGNVWFHSSSIGPRTHDHAYAAARISARKHCDSDSAAAFEAEKVPCGGKLVSA